MADAQSLIDKESKKLVQKSIRLETRSAESDYYATLKKAAKSQLKKEKKKWMQKPVISRAIFRKTARPTLQIRSFEPEPYRSIYFKQAYEQERKNLFFK